MDELDIILKNHRLWLSSRGEIGERAILKNIDLEGANLKGADLRKAILSYSDLKNANLKNANLVGADFKCANLAGANLKGADLRSASLPSVDSRKANLTDANLAYATLTNVIFREANLTRTNLRNANLAYSVLECANLRDTNLMEANLTHVDFSGAKNLLSPIEYIKENFKITKEGIVAYKVFGGSYPPPEKWKIKLNSIISENCNMDRTNECGCGINVAPLDWVSVRYSGRIWKVLIRWEWLCGVCVPYNTDGPIRCEKVQLIEIVE